MIRKLMKGITFVFVFSVFILLTNAAECIPPEEDTQTTLDRHLLCNASNMKTTHFIYPQSGQTAVFSNSLCSVSCNEDLLLLIDSAKNVRAGMGFSFPLYVSGQKKCTASYNYTAYDTSLRALVTSRDKEKKGTVKYQDFVNQINNMIQTKTQCDGWSAGYNLNASVSLAVETSEKVEIVPYVFVPTEGYKSTSSTSTTAYSSCDLKGDPTAKCTENTDTTSSWTQTSSVEGRYTMANRYIEKYTGTVVSVPSSKTCDAKDTYFTSFYEITRPVSTNPSDKGYSLKLTASNLGNNLTGGGDRWSLTVDCWYALKNLIFPQKTTTTTDEYYNLFGNTAFMYRQIDLTTPFPNRTPGENWTGKEKLITNTKSSVYDKALYEIVLNPETIRKIKEYNIHYKYDTFDVTDKGKSRFIEANPDIIKRK